MCGRRLVFKCSAGFDGCLAMPPSSVLDSNDETCGGSPQGAITDIQVVNAFTPNVSLEDVKVNVDTAKIADCHPMVEARRPSVSMTVEQVSDGVSIRSVATVHVSQSSAPDRPGPELTLSASRSPPSSPTRSNTFHDEPHATLHQRRARHRSVIEVRTTSAVLYDRSQILSLVFLKSSFGFFL